MKKSFPKIPGLMALMAGLLFLPFAALSQSEPIATVENFGDALVFTPNLVGVAQVVLTVTGPCDFQYREVISEGQGVFRLDATTIDGAYTYHLRREEAIDPGIVKVLLQARQNNDPETPRALCRDGKLPGPPAAQSEGFLVVQGKIIYDPEAVEGRGKLISKSAPAQGNGNGVRGLADPSIVSVSSADFVILDDLIVDGSACIGFDCVNGESFGFDTIRIKENNLRIKFDDTSVAASFPSNDWQLTANDSANGGASKFSIDDISGGRTPFTVEANARSHSLYVDDGGRIGSRTSTPSVELHTIDGDTPTLRLQQDGSSGFEPQTWDVAGNETNFFVRDVTNGSTLPLRIRPGAPTSAIFIDVGGEVGLGTSSPEAPLHVLQGGSTFALNADTHFAVQNNAATGNSTIMALIGGATGTAQIGFGRSGGGGSELSGRIVYNNTDDSMDFYASSGFGAGVDMTLDGNDPTSHIVMGNGATLTAGGVWMDGSSREYKDNIEALSLSAATEALQALEPVSFNYKKQPDEEYLGFIAEDVPELVAVGHRKGLAPMDIVAVLTKVLQDQQRTIEDQQRTIGQLNERLTEIESANQ